MGEGRPGREIVKKSTAALHVGLEIGQELPFAAGPVFASAYHLSGDPAQATYAYARSSNPSWASLEEVLGALEGGRARVFPSGMAAIAAVLTSLLEPGDRLVLPSDGYSITRQFAHTYLDRWGVDVVEIPTAGADLSVLPEGIDLLWLETPSNPMLDLCDIEVLATRAHDEGALVVVDNTTATPYLQSPLELGADVSVSSDTKAVNGHSDVLMGHVASRCDEILEGVALWRTLNGAIPGPMETWLVHRGLMTMGVRVDRQVATAGRVAELLAEHPAVTAVRYPGLVGDPSYALARRQMSAPGFLVGFTLEDAAAAERFLSEASLVYDATSFGGIHTTAERRARWGTDEVPEGFIRMSVGLEDPADLLADISLALDRVSG